MKTAIRMKTSRKISIWIAAIACVAIFIISFAQNGIIPGWDDIFELFNLTPEFNKSDDYICFFDVGQGDSILIYSNGESALIDTGPEESGTELCREISKDKVTEIDALIETHLHMDHVGGLEKVVDRFNIKNLILPDLDTDSEGFPATNIAKRTVTESNGAVFTAEQGMSINIGEFEITVLAVYTDIKNENDRSIISMIEIDDIRFLMMGDAEAAAEKRLLNENLDISCDVLKVAHHGSDTSCSDEFLKEANPRYAVISVGADNQYSHPHQSILNALTDCGIEIFRTDEDGNITFYVNDNKLDIELENYNS